MLKCISCPSFHASFFLLPPLNMKALLADMEACDLEMRRENNLLTRRCADTRREGAAECVALPRAQQIRLRRLAVHQHHAATDTQGIKPLRFTLIVNASCCLTNSAKLFDNGLKCAIDLCFITPALAVNVCHSLLCRGGGPVFTGKSPPRAPPLGAVDFLQHCLISGSNWKCTLKVNRYGAY